MILLTIQGNPLEEKQSAEGDWRDVAIKKLPKLKKLDGMTLRYRLLLLVWAIFPIVYLPLGLPLYVSLYVVACVR